MRQQDVFRFLKGASDLAETFRIIFADPPYEKMESGDRFTDKLLADVNLPRLLEKDGLFVLEKRPAENLPENKNWELIRHKTYGATEVLFLSAVRE